MEPALSARSRKRRRTALACEPCRKKKIKCDQELPCDHCKRSKKDSCHYLNRIGSNSNATIIANQVTPETITESPTQEIETVLARLDRYNGAFANDGLPTPQADDAQCSEHVWRQNRSPKIVKLPRECRTTSTAPHQPESTSIRGMFSKSRFYGQSHWAHSFHQLSEVFKVVRVLISDEQSGIITTFLKCKTLARSLKTQAIINQPLLADPREYVPLRGKADLLVEAYLRTFQSVYHVLDVPSFLQEYERYWSNTASQDFVMQLLLVMAIGSGFVSKDEEVVAQKSLASQWIYTAQFWLSSPFEKSRMNITGIQVHCLLLLARQVNSVGGDLISVSAGSLLSTAMTVGLHVDPFHANITSPDSDLRRHLWAIVLELAIQSATDIGVKPLVTASDYDCKLPNDTLAQSLPIRLQIARFVNDFSADPSYEEVLRLSSELTSICHRTEDSFEGRLLELLTLRFLLALHYPFAMQAKSDPQFHYSRKVSLQVSLRLSRAADGDFERLLQIGGAAFRGVPIQAISIIADEIMEQHNDFLSSKSMGQEMRKAVEGYVELTAARIKFGETSVKGHVIFSGLLAQLDAMEAEKPVAEAISNGIVNSLDTCHSLLETRMNEAGISVLESQDIGSFESWFGDTDTFLL